jgi:hypothetical protein
MCEHCGCQDLSPIDELTREHDLVLGLIGDVGAATASGDLPRMADLSRQTPIWPPSTGESTPSSQRRQPARPRIPPGQTA